MPLALASALVLVLFMTLPAFDANAYPHADTFAGAFPQQRDEGGSAGHDGNPAESRAHGGDDAESGHGGEEAGPRGHGGDQAGRVDHGRGRASSSDAIPSESFLGLSTRRFTVATGYVATGLLALTLLVGPTNLLLRKRNPVSSYLRRDAGMWTAVFSVVHVVYGLQVHGRLSGFLGYFVAPDGSPWLNSFGLGNWTGLAATVIVVGLLALSSDLALRKLKARTWKNLQRLNYALFVLVIAHALFYGALLRTTSPFTFLLLISVIAVFAGQAVGISLWRRRHASPAPARVLTERQRNTLTSPGDRGEVHD